MIRVRRGADRGLTTQSWLDSRHTFSFSSYRDPRYMGFRALRVVNDDIIAAGHGFGMHPHRDMEILTFVRSGVVAHQDSMGNQAVIAPSEIQRMSAGTGVLHSEMNPSSETETRLLQVWIEPSELGLTPGYEQRRFADGWTLVASADGREGSLTVHQDVDVYRGRLEPSETVTHALAAGRHAWVHLADGEAKVGGVTLASGDGAALSDIEQVDVFALTRTEILLFDLA